MLVCCQDGIKTIENRMMPAVDINRVDIVPVRGEINVGVWRGVDFLADGLDEWRERAAEFRAVEVSEGNICESVSRRSTLLYSYSQTFRV
jgi:hypothetical protein